jgi:DNA modification methylase
MKIFDAGLKPDTQNANEGTQRGLGLLDKSLRKLGAGRSILVDKDDNVIAGNKTLERAADIDLPVRIIETDGKELIAVKRTDLDLYSETDKRARQLAYADNKVAELDLAWKPEQIEVDFAPLDLGEWGFDDPNPFMPEDAEPQIDKAEELRVKWGVESGQMWKLGEHRIICGDCTDKAVVDRVMGGEKADMGLSDPPYALFGNSTGVSGITDDKMVMPFFREIFKIFRDYTNPFSHVYICCDWHSAFAIESAARDIKIPAKNLCVWDKGDGGVGAMYQQCYEFIWLFTNTPYKNKLGAGEAGERTVNGVPNIWRINRQGKLDRLHGAQKPIDLFEIPINNGSDESNIVLDAFLGSGTTIIACERLKRKCRAIEISPAYVAVSIQRWVDVTGGTPELVDTGN